MPPRLKIAIVDDAPLTRDGLIRALTREPGGHLIVAETATVEALDQALTVGPQPDVVILDLRLPGGGLTGIPAVEHLSGRFRVVLLTAEERTKPLLQALRAGAVTCRRKSDTADVIRGVTEAVGRGDEVISQLDAETMSWALNASPTVPFGCRELEVLGLLCDGLNNKAIASHLRVSDNTVRNHINHIYHALRKAEVLPAIADSAKDRLLVQQAHQDGVFSPVRRGDLT